MMKNFEAKVFIRRTTQLICCGSKMCVGSVRTVCKFDAEDQTDPKFFQSITDDAIDSKVGKGF